MRKDPEIPINSEIPIPINGVDLEVMTEYNSSPNRASVTATVNIATNSPSMILSPPLFSLP